MINEKWLQKITRYITDNVIVHLKAAFIDLLKDVNTIQQRIDIVELFYENVYRKLLDILRST